MNLEPCGDTVFRCREHPLVLDASVLAVLRRAAAQSPLRRARVCMHQDDDAVVQEMLIVLLRGVYIRPHKHPKKPESFHLVHGQVGVAFYDDVGRIVKRITLESSSERLPFYYRIDDAVFHSHVVLTDEVVFHECTAGPFRREHTVMAPWSPAEHTAAADIFVHRLESMFRRSPMLSST
jgi:cupin fold WbuC family metalloprotein